VTKASVYGADKHLTRARCANGNVLDFELARDGLEYGSLHGSPIVVR